MQKVGRWMALPMWQTRFGSADGADTHVLLMHNLIGDGCGGPRTSVEVAETWTRCATNELTTEYGRTWCDGV